MKRLHLNLNKSFCLFVPIASYPVTVHTELSVVPSNPFSSHSWKLSLLWADQYLFHQFLFHCWSSASMLFGRVHNWTQHSEFVLPVIFRGEASPTLTSGYILPNTGMEEVGLLSWKRALQAHGHLGAHQSTSFQSSSAKLLSSQDWRAVSTGCSQKLTVFVTCSLRCIFSHDPWTFRPVVGVDGQQTMNLTTDRLSLRRYLCSMVI